LVSKKKKKNLKTITFLITLNNRKEGIMEEFIPACEVKDIAHDVTDKAICDIETVLDGLKKVVSVPFMSNKIHLDFPKIEKALQRCAKLKRSFKIVRKDTATLRKMEKDKVEFEIPLVFSVELPAPLMWKGYATKDGKVVSLKDARSEMYNHGGYELKLQVPPPTKEAITAIKTEKVKKQFDSMELWWVPLDIMVEKIEPDPVLVGKVNVPGIGDVYFEQTRWIDESVESGYWTKEGY